MSTNSPSVLYARVIGSVLLLVGILGFFVNTDQDSVNSLLGFDVNITHTLVHLLTGLLGVAIGFGALVYARAYALLLGVVYLLVSILGFAGAGIIDTLFHHINTADNYLHLGLGVLGLAAGLMAAKDRPAEPLV